MMASHHGASAIYLLVRWLRINPIRSAGSTLPPPQPELVVRNVGEVILCSPRAASLPDEQARVLGEPSGKGRLRRCRIDLIDLEDMVCPQVDRFAYPEGMLDELEELRPTLVPYGRSGTLAELQSGGEHLGRGAEVDRLPRLPQELHHIQVAGQASARSEDRIAHAHELLHDHTLPASEDLLALPSKHIDDPLPKACLDERIRIYEA